MVPVFFVDRSLSRRLVPDALRAKGFEVVVHDDVFAPDVEDLVWLRQAGQESWVVLTKDDRIRYRRREWAMVEQEAVRCFALTNANLTGVQQAALLAGQAQPIRRWADSRPGPYVVGVYATRPHLRELAPGRRLRRG